MHKPIYTKLAADGSALPADSTEKHLAVRVEHPMLQHPIVIAAYRCDGEHSFKKAQEVAAKHDAYGWTWRTPTVEELFFVADRTNKDCELDKNFFPDARGYEWTWTSDVDAESPSACAWGVYLDYGDCDRGYQGLRYDVRAVLAGQF